MNNWIILVIGIIVSIGSLVKIVIQLINGTFSVNRGLASRVIFIVMGLFLIRIYWEKIRLC